MKINTIANWITLARFAIYLIALALLLTGNESYKLVILPLFIIAFLMDKLDGWAAKKFNQTSDVGVALDRAADRIIVTTLAISYLFFNPDRLILIIILTNLMRDFLVSGLRQLAAEKDIFMSKHSFGKVKFVVENISAILMISLLTVPALGELSSTVKLTMLSTLVVSSILGWLSFWLYTKEVLGQKHSSK